MHDKLVEVRIQHAILFKIKKMLVDWQFSRASLWVDEQTCSLTWNGDLVMQTGINNDNLNVHFGETWESFLQEDHLQSSCSSCSALVFLGRACYIAGFAVEAWCFCAVCCIRISFYNFS